MAIGVICVLQHQVRDSIGSETENSKAKNAECGHSQSSSSPSWRGWCCQSDRDVCSPVKSSTARSSTAARELLRLDSAVGCAASGEKLDKGLLVCGVCCQQASACH